MSATPGTTLADALLFASGANGLAFACSSPSRPRSSRKVCSLKPVPTLPA